MNSSRLHLVTLSLLIISLVTSILFFLPVTPNYFTPAKQIVLIFAVAIFFLTLVANALVKKELLVNKSHLGLPLLLFTLAIIANLFANKEGWVEGLTGRGSLYIVGALLAYFISPLSHSRRATELFLYTLTVATSLLALHSLLQLTTLYRLEVLPAYMASRAFTPTGSPLTTLTLLLIGAAATFYFAVKSLKGNFQYLFFVLGTLQTIAAVAYLSLMLPGSELAPNLLPYQVSWAVTLDALKSSKSFLFGVGLANFSSLYTSVKPLVVNAGPLWNLLPPTATSELLQLTATAGVLGLLTFLFLPFSIFTHRSQNSPTQRVIFVIFLLSFLTLILTPASIPLIVLFFSSAGLLCSPQEQPLKLSLPFSLSLTAVFLAATTIISYYAFIAYAAEHHLFLAQKALASNDGKTVYEQHIAAIHLIPTLTNYRLSYSQVNLSLASALSQKQDLTDTERSQVTTLVQQAIREAKLAASLRPHDVRTWQNLGSIYRNLINVADGADQFAVSAYAQAITVDPADPALRLEYGGLLYQLGNSSKDKDVKAALLNRAIQEFQTAVQLKSDYANGYYNLAKAFESTNNVQAAYAAMQKAVASLDPSSPDLSRATTDLETLKGKLPKASPTPTPSPSSSEISQPSPLPSPLKGGPIDLPQESPVPSPTQ